MNLPSHPYFIACATDQAGQIVGAAVCRAIGHVVVSEHRTPAEAEAALTSILTQGTIQ